VSLAVPDGKCVALLGGNGAGKSTTLKAISGIRRVEDGRVTSGNIEFGAKRIDRADPTDVVQSGIIHVMEGRRVLRHLSVEQNLLVGGHMEPS
ncbi:ATP-binding cassette domain-containing protein, partial [Acinetobacter baumannii]